MTACDLCVVRNRAICSSLESTELEALNAIGRRRTLKPGESLIWEGEDSVVVYPWAFTGRPFGSPVSHGVTALPEAGVWVLSRRDFDAFARDHPGLEHKLLERTLGELDRTRRWMLLLGRKSASEKVASFLLEMSERLSNTTCKTVGDVTTTSFTLPFSRQQIADVLGLTIETVSRQFTRLKQDGLIG